MPWLCLFGYFQLLVGLQPTLAGMVPRWQVVKPVEPNPGWTALLGAGDREMPREGLLLILLLAAR